MQFVVQGVKLGLKQVPKIIATTGKGVVKGSSIVTTRAGAFTRGVVTGKPKTVVLNAARNVTMSDRGAFLQSGIQVRQISIAAVKFGFVKGPVTVVKVAAVAGRAAVKDALVPYRTAVSIFRGYRNTRIDRGKTSAVERVIERSIEVANGRLNRLGLVPSYVGGYISAARFTVVAGIAGKLFKTGDMYDAIEKTLHKTFENYRTIQTRGRHVLDAVHGVRVGNDVRMLESPLVPAPAPAPVLPVADTTGRVPVKGGTRIIVPAVQRR